MILNARKICYRIVNPKILHDKFQLKSDPKLSFYPIVGMKQTKTGVMFFNKPDNNNNVTEQCADQLYRFLTSYHHDHTVENVWMESRGPAFSGGADYEQLLKNSNYLDKLMRLSIRIGQFNKPIFAKVNGSVRGISAYILSMFSTPLGTQRSTLRLDETSRGFIPIFGGSHRLSRLPCHIGLYLALTGDKIDSLQMTRLGFLKGKVRDQHTTKQITKHLSDANLFMRYKYTPSSHSLSEIRRQSFILNKMNYFYNFVQAIQGQIFKDGGDVNYNMAINQYRLAQTQYYNTINPYNSFSKQNFVVNNYFEMRHDRPFKYMKQKGIVQQGRIHNNLLPRLPVYKLLKIFSHDSMYKVMEQLQKDDSQWARNTQKMIRQKDPLCVHLTFNLIKNARNLSWVECLQEEYKVARRLLNISSIKHRQIKNSRSLKILQNPYTNSQIHQIPKQKIQQFFKPHQLQQQIFDHDTPNHSFLPTSDYWKQIPDAPRNYLNRTFFQDIHSQYGQVQVKRFLHLNRIDYRDRSYNIETLRQYMYKNIHYGRMIELEKQRLRGILQSQINYQKIKKQRKTYLQQKLKSQDISKLIAQQIKNYYNERFQKRFDQLNKTANIAGKESRMQTLRKYIDTLVHNIVLNGRQIEQKNKVTNLRHEGIVRFDNKGSDVFHAETQTQSSYKQLDIIKNAYKNRDPSKIQLIDPKKYKNQYVFFDNQFTRWQADLIRKDAALRLNYDTSIFHIQIREKYKRLIKSASSTSEQIAGLLQWSDGDIQNVLYNAPKDPLTFKKFAQNVLNNSQNIQQRINKLNELHTIFTKTKQNQIQNILSQMQDKNQESVKNLFFDTRIIPRAFRQAHLAIFEQVLNHFSERYEIDGKIMTGFQNQGKGNLISQWAKNGLKSSYTNLLKSDVQYIFSYLIIIHLKQLLSELQKQKLTQISKITQFLKQKYNINFSGMNQNQFNNSFMQYMYRILDMHEQSKHKIIFPQTKMIQFINRLKIDKQLSSSNRKFGISFDSLLFLIAKDRKMIRDNINGNVPLLGYDPQVTLNTLSILQKQYNTIFPNYKQFPQPQDPTQKQKQYKQFYPYDHLKNFSQNKALHALQQKRLITGFTHYLRRFEAMLQRAAGKTMFLPKQLYQMQNKKIYEQARQLLKVQLDTQDWFRFRLRSVVKSLFDFRLQVEKNMREGQLKLFDQQFSQFFSSDYLGLIFKYQEYSQEVTARLLIKDQIKQPSTNQQIQNWYLEVKSQVKNPRALKMLNNLIMTQNILKDKLLQFDQSLIGSSTRQDVTTQQRNDTQKQRYRMISKRTLQRLTAETFRYPQATNQVTRKNKQYVRKALPFQEEIKETRFISQLKEINKMLDGEDFRAELENRIRRIQALNL